MKIALLGMGTVGTGVYEIINEEKGNYFANAQEKVNIKKVLVRDKTKKRKLDVSEDLLTDSFDEILEDQEIEAVIFAMGGMEPEYSYMKDAMRNKKHVITANKAVVSEYLDTLLKLAEENNVMFLFEASVGGGIPIITSLKETLKINRIDEIKGILNGTSNFILSKMSSEGRDFDDVLKEAQELGFAEADPSADVDGFDVSRKLAILSSLAFGCHIKDEDIYKRGIREVSKSDMEMFDNLGYVLKYLAHSKMDDGKYCATVEPVLLSSKNIMSNVNEEFNIVSIHGNIIGELQFYGKGAGKNATANAVVGDLLYIINNSERRDDIILDKTVENKKLDIFQGKYYLRVDIKNHEEFKKIIDMIDETSRVKKMMVEKSQIFVVTEELRAYTVNDLAQRIADMGNELFYARIVQ
ncbi:homoserine dehydrogenase [Alkalibacter saccharofermentans]|uniref:Homoserine dehydrogenase n=1 Tax=Alkalibacter saccharofermentans DSM 14828 TaxID=1120975 RepID=A0A1M4YWC3_9FIRM|nr:homoserine dehydrogenase [Alkalibacter saccharofermentans]SHF10119.1 homoserine dehydrogenase [Alkalibacter saccharofermentans DSM 14828]